MIETLIRETNARWGLGDQGRPLVQMLVAYIVNPANGGINGFLDKFRHAGMGGMAASWMGNTQQTDMPSTTQIQNVLGGHGGLIQQIASRLSLSTDKVLGAVAAVVPALIGRMTPDGQVPAVLPVEISTLASEGNSLLAAAGVGAAAGARATSAAATHVPADKPAGMGKWLPWIIGALVVIFGLSYCNKERNTVDTVDSPPAATVTPAPSAVPDTPAVVEPVPTPEPLSETAPTGSSSSASSADGMSSSDNSALGSSTTAGNDAANNGHMASTQTPDAPTAGASDAASSMGAPNGAGVTQEMLDGMPVMRVFFDTGKSDVSSEFAAKSQALVDYLMANPDVKAVVSGFNDSTGDPARNAELSKQRAQAVQAALEGLGVASDRVVLEKPADTDGTGATNAASRRVDVMLRR